MKFYAIELLAKKGLSVERIHIPGTHKNTKAGCFIKMLQMCGDIGVVLAYLQEANKAAKKENQHFSVYLSKNQKQSFMTFFNSVKHGIKGKVPKPVMQYICAAAVFSANEKANKQFNSVDIKKCFDNFAVEEFRSACERMTKEMMDYDELNSSFGY